MQNIFLIQFYRKFISGNFQAKVPMSINKKDTLQMTFGEFSAQSFDLVGNIASNNLKTGY